MINREEGWLALQVLLFTILNTILTILTILNTILTILNTILTILNTILNQVRHSVRRRGYVAGNVF
jgi:hypothetical protein